MNDEFTVLNVDKTLVDHALDPKLQSLSRFLSNGARFYEDLKFAEYATPEVLTLDELVQYELAGERIVIDALIRFLAERPDIEAAEIHKRVIDDIGHTWGYHGNLLADRKRMPTFNPVVAQLIGLHIASSQAMLGAGTIQKNPLTDKHYYSYGQKILDISNDAGTGTTNGSKTLLNQRERSYADDTRYRRIHVTSLDPHISPWATKMGIGTLSLILRAIEQGKGDALRLHPHKRFHVVAQQNAKDLALERTMRLLDSSGEPYSITSLDLQQELIRIVSTTEHTDDETPVLVEWQRAIDDLRDDPAKLADRSDAICKLQYIRSLNIRNGHEPDDMSTAAAHDIDMQYDRIFSTGTPLNARDNPAQLDGMTRSIPHRLRTTKMSTGMPDEQEIQHARYNAPVDTRAFGRAAAIASGRCVSPVSWLYYTIDNEAVRTDDPYRPGIDYRSTPPKAKGQLTR